MKMLNAKKGFAISEVPTLAVTLGIVAIVLGIVATILTQVQATQGTADAATVAYNVTGRGIAAVDSFSQWQGTWAVIIAAAVVIGIIGMYLFFKPRE